MSEIITSIETSTWLRLLLLLLLLPWSVITFSPSHTRKFHFSLDPLTLILSFLSFGISSCFCSLLDCALEHEFLRILRVFHAYWSSHPAASFRMSKRESLFTQLIGLFLKMWHSFLGILILSNLVCVSENIWNREKFLSFLLVTGFVEFSCHCL